MNKHKLPEDDGLFYCPICFENYESSGDHTPRIFPCTHTVCEKCIRNILKNNELNCPTCRKKCRFVDGVKSFPENQYIVGILNVFERKEEDEFDQCREHKKDLSLYCKEDDCGEAICQRCLIRTHKGHNVVDVIEEHQTRVKIMIKFLSKKIFEQKMVQMKGNESLKQLERVKKEYNDHLDGMIEKVKWKSTKAKHRIQELEEEMRQLIKMDKKLTETGQVGKKQVESIKNAVSEKDERLLPCKCLEYKEPTNIKGCCGELKEKSMAFPQGQLVSTFNVRNCQEAIHLKVLFNGTILVCLRVQGPATGEANNIICVVEHDGSYEWKDGGEYALIHYDTEGKVLFRKILENRPSGVTEVILGNISCLALSWRGDKKIDFHNMNNLDSVLLSFPVAPFLPETICAESASTLLFVYKSETCTKVRSLVCSDGDPKLSASIPKARINYLRVSDMLRITHKERELLILAGRGVVEAYDKDSKLVWRIDESLPSMTHKFDPCRLATDGHSHLFALDSNNDCVQMFLVDDSSYIGTVFLEGGIENITAKTWCDQTSSLITFGKRGDISCIAIFKICQSNE